MILDNIYTFASRRFKCKEWMNATKTISFSEIEEILFEGEWEKQSQTNSAHNPLDDPYLFNILFLRLRNGQYLRRSPVTEMQVNRIKAMIHTLNTTESSSNQPQRQTMESEVASDTNTTTASIIDEVDVHIEAVN